MGYLELIEQMASSPLLAIDKNIFSDSSELLDIYVAGDQHAIRECLSEANNFADMSRGSRVLEPCFADMSRAPVL